MKLLIKKKKNHNETLKTKSYSKTKFLLNLKHNYIFNTQQKYEI